jgi:formate-dependent nitrite reductase membrane component NrfD
VTFGRRAPRNGDGRHIDPSIGLLEGEGSQQDVPPDVAASEGSAPFAVWEGVPSERPRPADPTYYERPVLKEPVWIWAVPAYFYVGSAAGAAAVLGMVARATGGRDLAGLVRRCRWIAATGDAIGTGLLIYDLGRPERFFNMLRVFRRTSPLSVGSWILAASTPLTATSALLSGENGLKGAMADIAGAGAGLLGMPMAGYTSVLLSNTAVPVWQEARRSLPPLFVASAMSSAASLLDLMHLNGREERIVHRFGLVGKVGALAAMTAVEGDVHRVEKVGGALREGLAGGLWRAAKGLTAASLGLSLVPGAGRIKRQSSAILGTGGAILMRFAVFHAGKASARDPRATFHLQRTGA